MKMKMLLVAGLIIAIVACCTPSSAQVNPNTPGYFPFWVPPFDVAESFTDMSFLNPVPAGAEGRVTVRDGHFVDGTGKRIRLLGSNVTFAGAFPDKKDAAAIAGHLRKLGVNVIRFHHLDMHTGRGGIWNEDRITFNPEQVDRLDWLIYQFKQHGIYSNLNLHVSRTYPGMPKSYPRAFRFGKGVDNFHAPFIQLQKDYARELLGHTNPYTGTTYLEEPAIIVVELNNENALTNKSLISLRELPEPLLGELTGQWRAWLKKRYGTTERLRTVWGAAAEPPGDELLSNRDFGEGATDWTLEQGAPESMKAEPVADADVPSGRALKLTTSKHGPESWSLQFHQNGLDLAPDAPYTVCFWARADETRRISLSVRLDKAPWRMCGLDTTIKLGNEWREYRYTFQCLEPEPNHVRFSLGFRNQLGTFWIADTSLRRGGWVGLPKGQSLEAGNIPLPPDDASLTQRSDFRRFASDTECRYVADMMAYLRQDLGLKALLCDSQASYGGLLGMLREGVHSDFVDMHAYWQHPHFPNKPWDSGDWRIGNTSMTAIPERGALGGMAAYHLAGKPFTVSEYDHPAPSDYAAEMFPLLASFAAFQDWDGLYQFNYNSRHIRDDERRMANYFDLWTHPGKLVFLPIAALMFRMEAVAPGTDRAMVTLPADDIAENALDGSAIIGRMALLALTQPVGYRLAPGRGKPEVPSVESPADAFRANTGELMWNAADPARAFYTVNAPAVRVAIGRIGGMPIYLGDVTITVSGKHDWAAVAVGALDGKPIAQSKRVLIAAVGRVENSNMGWNEARNSVGKKWGTAPVVAEGIEARIQLPGGAHVVRPLDGSGTPKPGDPVPSDAAGHHIGPACKTLWYAVSPS